MKIFSKLEIALLTAAFVAAAIAPALAQQSVKVPKIKNRDEAIKTCLELVRSHFPLDTQGARGTDLCLSGVHETSRSSTVEQFALFTWVTMRPHRKAPVRW